MNLFHKRMFMASILTSLVFGQGVTTSTIRGYVTDTEGKGLLGANVIATHVPSGSVYGAATAEDGRYTILNMKIGGPYMLKVAYMGYAEQEVTDAFLSLGVTKRIDFSLSTADLAGETVEVMATRHEVMSGDRTGAATTVNAEQLATMPSIKRSTRDLTRLDPRSDGNYSFGGRNWLYNSISVDGSNFNNPFGLDDPAPGGQANAEPIPFEAVEQVQVSVAPFDVREGGFTGAGINTVTKSGTNEFQGSFYSYTRSEALLGNEVDGVAVVESPDLAFNQSGFTVSGPVIKDKLFFFINGELERRDDPGTNYYAGDNNRVDPTVMDAIRDQMMDVYGYDTGDYQDYIHETNNDKLLVKIDWNISAAHKFSFRYNMLDAYREQGPHPFVLSAFNTGRGPNSSSLPFQNSGYRINNELKSYTAELNSVFGEKISNRFFVSFNQFRDSRDPFSEDFPTIEIAQDGVTYTTLGHEPFSIHNILDQDVLQLTNNLSYFMGNHVITAGINYESYSFFNSFNIFRHGLFMVTGDLDLLYPGAGYLDFLGATTYSSLDNFFIRTGADPDSADYVDFRSMVGSGSFKGENIEVGQLAFYAQDEFSPNPDLNLTAGLRVDIPMYTTEPIDNAWSRDLIAYDENGDVEEVDQSKLPDAQLLYSPRLGFNWDVKGDRSMQLRGGTGIFTGRIPFVWYGNVISNPGTNPEIDPVGDPVVTDEDNGRGTSTLQQSFDVNAMVDDFKWPQVWSTNIAVDKILPWDMIGTLEMIYGKDLNAIYMRNADLPPAVRNLDDGRPYYTDADGNFENNVDEGAGIYVIDNTSEGYNFTFTGQLRKYFSDSFQASLAYTFLDAKNNLKSTEIASVLWQSQPVQGDPNNPKLSTSEFGSHHRLISALNYRKSWSKLMSTSFGLFFEAAEGNAFTAGGGNRYSFIYAGDVNGDGYNGNDLIYIPEDANDINLADPTEWADLNAFIEQDEYLKDNRGKIADRFSSSNPWFTNIDLRVAHDINMGLMGKARTLQISLDVLNVMNLVNNSWGVRQMASPQATSPLALTGWDTDGEPIFDFTGPEETLVNSLDEASRWRMQMGAKLTF
ncbi:TonB-dependent receptor [bacterium]|nr:TonB-dependent receptor [bacterium]